VQSKAVVISGIKHQLNGLSLKLPPTYPYERPYPSRQTLQFQHFTWSQRIEVTNQDVKAFLMTFYALEQRPNFSGPALFIPLRKPCAQVKPEDTSVGSGGHDLHKRMPGTCRGMPLVVANGHLSQIAYGVIFSRRPESEASEICESFNNAWISGLLKYNQVWVD